MRRVIARTLRGAFRTGDALRYADDIRDTIDQLMTATTGSSSRGLGDPLNLDDAMWAIHSLFNTATNA